MRRFTFAVLLSIAFGHAGARADFLANTTGLTTSNRGSTICHDPAGNFWTVWDSIEILSSPVQRRVVGRRFARSGSPLTAEVTLIAGYHTSGSEGEAIASIACAADGGLAMLIESNDVCVHNPFCLTAHRYDAAGNALPMSFVVDPTPGAYGRSVGGICLDGAGNWTLVWREFTGVNVTDYRSRRIDDSGTPLSPEATAASGGDLSSEYGVACQTGAGFVLAWGEVVGPGVEYKA